MKRRQSGSLALTASAVAIVALVASSMPVTVDMSKMTFGDNAAFAGNGHGNNGNGNGNGGGTGNKGNSGNTGNSGNAGATADAGSSGNATGHNKGDLDGDGIDDVHANELGRLNAAHASETALANANENSAVGTIAGYSNDVQEGNLADAATNFGEAANKSVTEAIVHAVNELLGIDDNAVAQPEAPDDADTDVAAADAEGDVDGVEGDAEGDAGMDVAEGDGEEEGGLTVHDTEPEIAARVNGTFGEDDADQAAPHDS